MHSEDVHTGFDLGRSGWKLLYVPIILAKGVCPNNLRSFFRQQYRWCKGSMSLLWSEKFRQTKISLTARLCYISGFLYYISTGLFSVVAPLIPLSLLILYPEQARITNYLLLIPTYLYVLVVLPLWHRSRYRGEVFTVKFIYGWAHLFALIDTIINKEMPWQPTGSANEKSFHFRLFQAIILLYSLPIGIIWMVASVWYMAHWNVLDFSMLCVVGVVYTYHVLRVIALAFGETIWSERIRFTGLGAATAVVVIGAYLAGGVLNLFHAKQSIEQPNDQLVIATALASGLESVESDSPSSGYFAVAQRGDSSSTLSRKILSFYLDERAATLSPWERMFVETQLVKFVARPRVKIGEKVNIDAETIADFIAKIPTQSPAQIATWNMYARAGGLK